MWQKFEKKDIKFYIGIFIVLIAIFLMLDYQYSVEKKWLDNEKSTIVFTTALIITILTAIIVCSMIYLKKDITEEKVFLYSIPIICLLFLFAMPIFKGHDEGIHWQKAYEVSLGKVLFSNDITIDVPENIVKEVYGKWFTINYKKIAEELIHVRLEPERIKTLNRVCTSYPSIQYAPQALGIAIARLCTDRVLVMAYSGRIINCIVSLIICYQALKIMPFAKKSLLSLLYIPILIEGFTSLSGDAILISVSYLFIAYVLKLIFEEKNSKLKYEQKLILFILAVLVSMCKMVYLPLVFLILLIPNEKFKNKKSNIIYKVGSIFICIAIAIVIFNFSMNFPGESREGSNSNVQLKKVLTNPIRYAEILLSSMNQNGAWYFETLFGSHLSWNEDIPLNFVVPYGLCALITISAVLDNDIKEKLNRKQKYQVFFIVVVSIVLVFSSMYIAWTRMQSNLIEGVQGRYFLPLMPLILILIGSIPIKSYVKEETMIRIIGITGIIIQVYIIMSIIIRQL